ncbi:MAG TPA: sugar porter family MFS transporter [Sedimentisphaerales bacterium]|nr:sugar porter family MFS transporter [Sedimentisphaerales bacterium]
MDAHSISQSQARTNRGGALLLTSAVIAALGSFLFGFDTAVIAGTTERLQELYSLSDSLKGFTVASALIGTLFGALLVGRLSDRWGRRPVLTTLAAFYVVSAVGCGLAWDWWSLLFFRWLGGIAVGGASVVSPMYITEIAPPRRRGLLVAVSQLNIVVGILAAYFSNYFVARAMGADHPNAWRWMFGVEAIPAMAFLIASLRIPESPRWLVKKGRGSQAEEVLNQFGHENPAGEVAEISASLTSDLAQGRQSLLQRKYLKPLLLVAMIAAFNQLDGINAVIYYTTDIFRMAGMDKTSALKQSVIIGVTNLVMTVLAMAVIDRVGRKSLLLAGSVTFVLSHALAAWVFHTHAQGWIVMVAMMGIVGSHAYSQGAVVWVCINELLPNAVRASGSAAACFLIWLLCIGVTWGFPIVAGKPTDPAAAGTSAAPAFVFFGVMMVAQFVLVWKYLPETKGVSLEELQKRLGVEE